MNDNIDVGLPQAKLPRTDSGHFLLETGKRETVEAGINKHNDIEGNRRGKYGETSVNGKEEKSQELEGRYVAVRMNSRNSSTSKHSGLGRESVDSGIASNDDSQHSSRLATLKDAVNGVSETQVKDNETSPLDKLIAKSERRVTFVDEEKSCKISEITEYEQDDDGESLRGSIIQSAADNSSQQKLSHHQVIVIDGDTGHVEVLPREKTRVVDESAFLRNKVGGMSLKSNKIPQINGAYLRPSTSERTERGGREGEFAAMAAKADPDLENIFTISRENAGTRSESSSADDTASLSEMNTASILPPISENPYAAVEQGYASGITSSQSGEVGHVIGDEVTSSASFDRDDAHSKTSASSGGGDGARHHHTGSSGDPQRASVDIALDDDQEAARRRAREERMRERRKLEDDMHKYHVGIANRTFNIPNYEVSLFLLLKPHLQ